MVCGELFFGDCWSYYEYDVEYNYGNDVWNVE